MTGPENSGAPDGFFDDLEEMYRNEGLEDYWENERPILEELIPKIGTEIDYNYGIIEPIGVGGGGIVIRVIDQNLGEHRTLKIARPSEGFEVKNLLSELLQKEKRNLLRLSHQNLIKIYAQGSADHDGDEYPFYVMEFVEREGGIEATDYLRGDRSKAEIFDVLYGVLKGIAYLHTEENTIHMDIKPENILVNEASVPLISDLGWAKNLEDVEGKTIIGGTDGFIHPKKISFLSQAESDPNRHRGEVDVNTLKEESKRWDLYALGKTFIELMDVIEENNPKVISRFDRRYLRLLSTRMLDGENNRLQDETPLGLPPSAFEEIKYGSILEVKKDFEKLIGIYDIESAIPELKKFSPEIIKTSTIETTPFSQRVRDIVNDPNFSRLGSITQLGLLNLIYPSATHTRLEHSLGTFSVACQYITALYNDSINPLFKQIMTEEDIKSGLLAALLADIDQFPLAHDIAEADPYMYQPGQHFPDQLIVDDGENLREVIENQWEVPPERVVDILSANPTKGELEGSLKDRILKTVISGPLGADRIDYLRRDSYHLDKPYGMGIGYQWLLRNLTVIFRRDEMDDTFASLGIHEDGKIPAESVAFAHYAIFGAIYWHHTFRAIKSMIHRLVWEGLENDQTAFRDDFRSFCLPGPGGTQARLVEDFGITEDSESQVHHNDLEVLEWFNRQSGDEASELVDNLRNRDLYKRIFVLSKEDDADSGRWEELADFYKRNSRSWEKKVRLQQEFESRMFDLVRDRSIGDDRVTEILTEDNRQRFIADSKDHIMFLLDLPASKSVLESNIEYLKEEDQTRDTDGFEGEAVPLRVDGLSGTIVWETLQDNFYESIRKFRVYCHPDHCEFVSKLLDRQEIQTQLDEARKAVEQS